MEQKTIIKGVIISLVTLLVLIIACMFGIPKYNVWKLEMRGKAELAQAEQNRQIKIAEASANLEAERLNAEAEYVRACGAAKAIKEENGQLTPTYIQYLWVRSQANSKIDKIIYIPTEASLPLLEAKHQ